MTTWTSVKKEQINDLPTTLPEASAIHHALAAPRFHPRAATPQLAIDRRVTSLPRRRAKISKPFQRPPATLRCTPIGVVGGAPTMAPTQPPPPPASLPAGRSRARRRGGRGRNTRTNERQAFPFRRTVRLGCFPSHPCPPAAIAG
jgi:hypothetical protein